jgi:hypothetical protein
MGLGYVKMLPNVANGTARRCEAICRARGDRCKKLAVTGCRTCRSHGGHKRVKKGSAHWNHRGAAQSRVERRAHSAKLLELRELEALSFALGLAVGPKWRGRKPSAVSH